MAKRVDLGGATVTFHPAGHVLGSAQIAVEADGLRIVASGDYKNVRRSDLRAVRAGRLRRLHHRGDFCAAGVPPRRSGRRDRKAPAFGRAVSRTRASGRRLFARQGAARDRAAAQGRLHRADLSARRDGEDHRLLRRAAASRSANCALVRGAGKAELAGTITICPPSALNDSGRGAFPIRSPLLPPAGCGCGRARASTASRCRWSFPITPTGTG